jgi:PAS domain S-box-containing protein
MFQFFEFSNEMLCVADNRGYLIRVNQAWTKALGWSAQELMSRPYVEFLHPDDVEATLREAHLLLTGTHETISFENRYRSRDGSYRWLSWHATIAPGLDQLVAAARDVTSHKLQTEALQEAEERFDIYMNHSPAIAWAKDEQGRLVYLNKTAEEKNLAGVAEWRGKTTCELWPQEIAQQLRQNDEKVLASGVPITVVEELSTHNGPQSYWTSVKFPYQDRKGQRYVGGIGIDVTGLKNAEAALRNEQELLRKLIEVQENEKQILCQEFHDGLIQYAVGALMLLEGYQNKHSPSEDSAILDAAIGSLRKGVEDGRRAIRGIRPSVLDDSGLEAAIEDLIDQFSPSGIMVTAKCDPDIGRLPKTIQTTIYRVVQESLNNARKHSGTDVVRIELRKVKDDLQLEIRDFGCGFEIESAGKRGFGLRGMIERVRLLGGECTIESEKDAGTQILIRLPLPTMDVDDTASMPGKLKE